jgi:hypothetical protein
MPPRAELAKRVLQMLKEGQSVPTQDILQLRNWASTSEDSVLPLKEIARRILNEEEDSESRSA